MFKLKKLNSAGVAHHAILMLVVVMAIAGFGAYQVAKSNADAQYTGKMPNGCFPGKKPGPNGGCQLKTQINQIKEDCTAYFLQFDGSQCKPNCIAGYHINDGGVCAQNQTPPPNPGGGGGGGSGGGGSGGTNTDKTPTECDRLNRDFNASNKQCGSCKNGFYDADGSGHGVCSSKNCSQPYNQWNSDQKRCGCVDGYHLQSGTTNVCVANQQSGGGTNTGGNGGGGGGSNPTPTTGNSTAKAECNAAHKVWHGGQTNGTCGPECMAGYNAPATDGVCAQGATPTASNNGGGNGGSNNDVKLRCAGQHLEYNANTKQCGKQCVSGYVKLANGACAEGSISCQGMVIADGTCIGKNKIEDYCKNFNLKYNKSQNLCETTCVKNYSVVAGICTKNGTDASVDPPVLNLDTAMNKQTCQALGRQWEPGTRDAQGNVIKGCSANVCEKKGVTIVSQADAVPYCTNYITKIDKDKCTDKLHRNWVNEAAGCMQNPKDKSAGAREASAPQCKDKYSTYVWKSSNDECMDPSVVDQLSSVAQATGKPFLAVSHLTQSQLCNIQPKKHWNGTKCVQDKPAQSSGNGSGQNVGSGDGTDDNGNQANQDSTGYVECGGPVGRVQGSSCPFLTRSQCASLHRVPQSGSNPCGGCAAGWTPSGKQGVYDACMTAQSTSTSTGNHGCPAGNPDCGNPTNEPKTGTMLCETFRSTFDIHFGCPVNGHCASYEYTYKLTRYYSGNNTNFTTTFCNSAGDTPPSGSVKI